MLQADVIHGDSLEELPNLVKQYGNRLVIISDPPYGGNYDTDYTRFSGGSGPKHRGTPFEPILGDDKDFDPVPFLGFRKVTLWGYQHFSQRVPLGTILFWQKKADRELGVFLSDGELAWEKGGMGVYKYAQRWNGFNRDGESAERGQKSLHPTQKPVGLMRWCIERQKLDREKDIILDPFCGSGSTLVAAIQLGFNCIGIEKSPTYVPTIRQRVSEELAQPRLFLISSLVEKQDATQGIAQSNMFDDIPGEVTIDAGNS